MISYHTVSRHITSHYTSPPNITSRYHITLYYITTSLTHDTHTLTPTLPRTFTCTQVKLATLKAAMSNMDFKASAAVTISPLRKWWNSIQAHPPFLPSFLFPTPTTTCSYVPSTYCDEHDTVALSACSNTLSLVNTPLHFSPLPFLGFHSLPSLTQFLAPPHRGLDVLTWYYLCSSTVCTCLFACLRVHSFDGSVAQPLLCPLLCSVSFITAENVMRIDGRLTGRPAWGWVTDRPPDPYYSQLLPLCRSRNHSLLLSCLGSPHQGTKTHRSLLHFLYEKEELFHCCTIMYI